MLQGRLRPAFAVACIALLALLWVAALPTRAANAPKVVKLAVPATTLWLKTSVKLKRGESAAVSASGTISYGSGDPTCRNAVITADGCAEAAPYPGGAGGLVARVGGGAPVFVGRSATVTGPGTIELGINDWESELGNNTGAFDVTIRRGVSVALPSLPPPTDANSRLQSVQTKAGRNKTGGVTITRNGERFAATVQSQLQAGDVISTDGDTILTLEFLIGGRVGLSSNASIRIIDDRVVEALGGTTTATETSRRPIEIQTNGGTMGIRG